MLFSSAKPVSKRVFLDVLHQTSFLTQFFVAPFGLPKSCLDTFGSSSEIGVDVYTEIYHQWEEIVSRVLYSSRGIPDSCIAASMHEYAENQRDSEILNAIREAASGIKVVIKSPKVVQLPDNVTAAQVADMLLRMAHLFKKVLGSDPKETSVGCKLVLPYGGSTINVTIPSRQLTAHDVLSNMNQSSSVNSDMLNELWEILSPNGSDGEPSKCKDVFVNYVTATQFSALLDYYCESPEVNKVLTVDLNLPVGGAAGLLYLRCGVGNWYPTAHPDASYISIVNYSVREKYIAAYAEAVKNGSTSLHDDSATVESSVSPDVTVEEVEAVTPAIPGTSSNADHAALWTTDEVYEPSTVHEEAEAVAPAIPGTSSNADHAGLWTTDEVYEPSTSKELQVEEDLDSESEGDWEDCSEEEDDEEDISLPERKTTKPKSFSKKGNDRSTFSDFVASFIGGGRDEEDNEKDGDVVNPDEESELEDDDCYDSYSDDGDSESDIESESVGAVEENHPTKPWVEVTLDSVTENLYGTSSSISKLRSLTSLSDELLKLELEKETNDSDVGSYRRRRNTESDEEDIDVEVNAFKEKSMEESVENYEKVLETMNRAHDILISSQTIENGDVALPDTLMVKVLVDRAKCKLKLGELEGAMSDCMDALELDSHCYQAYACRADVRVAMLELDPDGEESDCGHKAHQQEQLYLAGKDCLRAFLLGGSTNLELAAKAEDMGRQACQHQAKEVYRQRVEQRTKKPVEESCNRLNTAYLPRPWLVSSYLQGYEELERALELDSKKAIKRFLVEHNQTCSDTDIGTDDRTGDSSASVVETVATPVEHTVQSLGHLNEQIPPPSHLLDLDALEIYRRYDFLAYSVVRRVVDALGCTETETDTAEENSKSDPDEILGGYENSVVTSIEIHRDNTEEVRHIISEDDYVVELTEDVLTEAPVSHAADVDNSMDHINSRLDCVIQSINKFVHPVQGEEACKLEEVAYSACYFNAYQVLLNSTELMDVINVQFDVNAHGSIIVHLKESPEVEDKNDDVLISAPLHARLLNLCGTIAFLAGDSIGAVSCLRKAFQVDDHLIDTYIKLGCLLIDMDELGEAHEILSKALLIDPTNPIILLHMSEFHIHSMDYKMGVEFLNKALYHLDRSDGRCLSRGLYTTPSRDEENKAKLAANIYSLLGVAQFRAYPTRPEVSIGVLDKGVKLYPDSIYLWLCRGEILSQVGDVVKALQHFKTASTLEKTQPLPYVNASRTYQQLNQPDKALIHIKKALQLDSYLPMTYVDLAQIYLHIGRTSDALAALDHALLVARHMSEIRDVLTAQTIAKIQLELEEKEGVCRPHAYMYK